MRKPSRHLADRPSTATKNEWLRLSTSSVISAESGITIGRMFSEWGATAVITSTPVPGTMMGPPFDSE